MNNELCQMGKKMYHLNVICNIADSLWSHKYGIIDSLIL